MYEATSAMFIYCVSPVHMGAGTALGAIDNPIQRERHTQHPVIAGSGLKGALRHYLQAEGKWGKATVELYFGPETNASDYAGALSLGDGQLVAFPVRSLRGSFVYATAPSALARLQRLAVLAGVKEALAWRIPEVSGDGSIVVKHDITRNDGKQLILEAFEFRPSAGTDRLEPIATWLGAHAIPDAPELEYFRKKLKDHLVVLAEERFDYFVRHATLVEPHVRIDDTTGTADEGGLFYSENVPPEAIFVSLAMASRQRQRKGTDGRDGKGAKAILAELRSGSKGGLHGSLVQVGGDASTGRGQVLLSLTEPAGGVGHG